MSVDSTKNSVNLQIQGKEIEVFPEILSFYSPAIREWVQNNQIGKLEEETSTLMREYLMFFQPEKRQDIEIAIDTPTIDAIMELSVKYKTPWLNVALESYILTKKNGSYEDSEFFEEENCKRNIQGLLIAQKYNMSKLEFKLLNFNYCSFEKLEKIEGFSELNESNSLKLAIKRIPHAVEEYKVKGIFKAFKGFYEDNTDKKIVGDDIYVFHENEADVVITCAAKKRIHVHSNILRFYSSKFEISTVDNKQMINMADKPFREVEIFIKSLYASQCINISGRLDYDALVSLSRQYEVQWITEQIEAYLINNYQTAVIPSGMWGSDDEVKMAALKLADIHRLNKLRNHLIKKSDSPSEFFEFSSFKELSMETRYLVIRKCISMHPSEKDGEYSSEGKGIIRFLDKHYKK